MLQSSSKPVQQSNRKTSPKRSRRSNPHKRNKMNQKSETCDVLTGKPLTSVYFDPSHVVDKQSLTNDADWLAEHLYDEATLIKEDDGLFTLKLRSGEVFKVDEITTLSANEKDGVPDILKLHCFSEKSLIHTLRIRYARNQIYTFAGPILVSINPYQSIPHLYDEEVIQQFHRSPLDERSASEEVAPHLYAITEKSYHNLLIPGRKRNDQVIIISGESGAGKTEATKLIMTYLASITTSAEQHDRTSRSPSDSLEQRVLNSNPILEAFGNAKTLRNDNSSRFGKFIKINFNESGRIAGAVIEKYLLEKTRLVRQMPGERNYHIFYQLLRGAPASLLAALHLDDRHNMGFEYLSNGEMDSSSDDANDFAVTGSCLSCVGIDEGLQQHVFELLAGILHLGDVEFLTGSGGGAVEEVSVVSEETLPQLQRAAALFGLDPQELLLNMVHQNMYVNGSVIVKQQTIIQARDKRNSFSKTVYNQLFSWLVDKVNLTISPSSGKKTTGYIGLLDIYGFENFLDANSFEQLLINYANEKLQNYFNKHIFQIEQAEYDAESIDWSYIEFRDNQACLDLIDAKPMGKTGIFQTLDDCISSNGRSDPNVAFLSALNQLWSGSQGTRHPNFLTARFNSHRKFGIFHYAGEVYYEIEGFSEKNSEATNLDMKDLMMKSNNLLLRLICDDKNAAAAVTIDSSGMKTPMKIKPSNSSVSSMSKSTCNSVSRNKLREDSISKQFTSSLKHLFTNIELAQPHFIRCIKPNEYKRPNVFNAGSILTQLKYAGMIEAIRIRQQGYALRIEYSEWFSKFSRLAPDCTTLHQLVDRLSSVLAVSDESWQVGTTKIFIRHEMNDKLDRLLAIRRAASVRVIHRFWRSIRSSAGAVKIQRFVRNVMKRRRAIRYLRDVVMVQSIVRRFLCKRQYKGLTRAVATIQRVGLGKFARIRVRKLRNPFNSMSYYDLVYALRTKQTELRAAFDAQSFATCSDIESSMVNILWVRRKLSMPHVEPQSRDLVELHILETQFAIEAGQHRKDLTDSALHELQERLQQLLSLRKGFPTMKELTGQLEEARSELKCCMQKKQFKRCAELQSTVTALESTLERSNLGSAETMVSTFELKQKPLVDLRGICASLEKRMEESLEGKHFEQCASLQLELDRVLDVIKLKDLSAEDALLAQQEVQLQMKASREVDDYLMMAELQLRLEDLNMIVSEESHHHHQKSPVPVVPAAAAVPEAVIETTACREASMSAADIRLLIREKNAAINAALQKKQYSTCDQLNAEVEQLQHKLDQLPTFAKVKAKMELLRHDLNELISKKMYSKCASIEQEIEQLSPLYEQLRLEEELSNRDNIDNSTQQINRDIEVLKPIVAPSSSVVTKQSIQQNITATVHIPTGLTKYQGSKPVSKLRPRVPITALQSEDILAVALKMAAHRVDAALLLDFAGHLCGIITDNDLTRRVVSQFVDIRGTAVDSVMTRSPKCVRNSDSALDALEMMVDNRFRHLPVLDARGSVVGLLDITRCLYDTISVLEKVQDSSDGDGSSASSGSLAIAQAVTMAMKSTAGGRAVNPAQLQAMQLLMEQMFGGAVPTLRSIIGGQAVRSIPSSSSVREASHLMAEQRKGVLVMDEVRGRKQLVGIITPKDILNRVITQQRSPDDTAVSSVMTPNPDCVSGDLTLLDALREMHDHRYLHLPVRDDRDGSILGLVDVMELVCSTAGEGDGGKGWRDFFSGVLNAKGDNSEDNSESASNHHSNKSSKVHKSKVDAKPPLSRGKELEKPVSKLRPRVPITALQSEDILAVALKMAAHRVDAALLLDSAGHLCGIITDNDLTRRVVSQFVDIHGTAVDSVMTRSPKCVLNSDSALDALEMMVDNRFRHLPVLDARGSVVGLLDITRCLYDTISVLEKVQDSSDGDGSSASSGSLAIAQAVTMAMKSTAGGRAVNPAQLQAMQLLMEQMFGGAVPTLRSILNENKKTVHMVRESINVREACVIMTANRKGLLVMDENDVLVGIITPKDILNRVIAKGLPPDLTAVSSVMTPNPDCVSGDLTLLDALREMHDHRYLHLPVRDDRDGSILGLVDVMELVCSTAGEGDGGKGWRDFFSGGLNAKGDYSEDNSETRSACSHISMSTEGYSKAKSAGGGLLKAKRSNDREAVAGSDLPSTVVDRMYKQQVVSSPSAALLDDDGYEVDLDIKVPLGRSLTFKCIVSDADGLRDMVASKLSLSAVDRSSLQLHMVDEVGSEVQITSDSMLMESIHRTRSMGLSVKIVASLNSAPIGRKSGSTLLLVGGSTLLCISLIAVVAVVLKKNKYF